MLILQSIEVHRKDRKLINIIRIGGIAYTSDRERRSPADCEKDETRLFSITTPLHHSDEANERQDTADKTWRLSERAYMINVIRFTDNIAVITDYRGQ